MSADGFLEWKYRIEKYIKMKDFKIWKCVIKDPVRITTTVGGQVVDMKIENYTNEDFESVEEQGKALAILTMALSPDVAQGFREYTSAKALWEALIEVYEGNEDMRESRQDMLRQQFSMFNYVPGETLEAQLQWFTTLNTKMIVEGIFYTKSEINNKLLNALPKSWYMNVAVIKKTKDLNLLSLDEVMVVIKACDIDDKQREINHVNSYSAANLGISTNNALSSFSYSSVSLSLNASPQAQTLSHPSASPTSVMPYPQNQSFVSTQTASSSNVDSSSKGKEGDENLVFAAGLVNCYNVLVAGELPHQLSFADLDPIHPEDVEEMDITWQIAMAVFRAKQFAKKTGKNNWGMNADKKVGFNKGKLRCLNCHETGHFARDCPHPDRRVNNDRTMVAVGNSRSSGQANNEKAMVAQSFDWDDQIQALNLSGPETAHRAQVRDDAPAEIVAAEDSVMELQFALMVSSSHEPNSSKVCCHTPKPRTAETFWGGGRHV
ncbi:hypothetical protein Lser_V15G14224 [Lactuca serriola]